MPINPRPGGSSEYGTPRFLFDYLQRRFAFDYDAFADHDWRLPVPHYSTKEGTFLSRKPGADPVRLNKLDGFDNPWTGRRVIFNPPYKPQGMIRRAVEKSVLEISGADIIVAILPVDPSASWWKLLIRHAHLEYLEGRPSFIDRATGLPRTNSTVPVVIAQFHPDEIAWRRHEPPPDLVVEVEQ